MGRLTDPWQAVVTVHNLPADEVISALQKEIRRGHSENAVLLAYEMLQTSEALEEKLWSRLLVISVEDVGFGERDALVLVKALFDVHAQFSRKESDRFLFAIHAVRYLCLCEKDRSNDEMLNWIRKTDVVPEIPDYAVDMHTKRGKAMGRGLKHFLEEGACVSPEKVGREETYRQRLLKLLEKE